VQLTGLQDLEVLDPEPLSAVGLRHLAGLEQLTRLRFCSGFDSSKVNVELQEHLPDNVQGYRHAIVNKVGAGCLVVDCGGCVCI